MPEIHGNTEGIRKTVLDELTTLYDVQLEPGQFMPQDLLQSLCGYSASMNREIAVYITRFGEVADVLIGRADSIDLPDLRLRRGERRLSMVRCVHTHPRATGELSDVDVSALLSMRFDAMCAVGVSEDGRPTSVQCAFLDAESEGHVRRTELISARRLPQEEWLAEIERTVANGNLRGAGMEPGCGAIPMYVDDARLYPIYQYCSDRSIPMFLMGGGGNGPDLSYSNPEHIDRVCRDFPKLAVVNMHGSYPWVPQVLFSCMCRPNMYLAPDMYMYNMPGAADYVTAANGFLRDRFLFGSGYPYIPLKQAVDLFVAMPFDRSILPNLLYKNMARVLKLDVD